MTNIKYFREHGADNGLKDNEGSTHQYLACQKNTEMIKFRLHDITKINEKDKFIREKTLHRAVQGSGPEWIRQCGKF